MISRKLLGNTSEAKILAHFISLDYQVFLPFIDNGPIDMIVIKENKILRVSVKGTTTMNSKIAWRVSLNTSSRRKDNSCVVNKFNKDSCDLLAVYIQPKDKVVILDSKKIESTTEISLKLENDFRLYVED